MRRDAVWGSLRVVEAVDETRREGGLQELFELGVLSEDEVRAELGHEPERQTHSWIARLLASDDRALEQAPTLGR